MNFIEAIRLGKDGKKIRLSWWANTSYIKLVNEVFLWDTGGKYIVKHRDVIADNWEIYEEKAKIATARLKTYTFQEAFKAFKNGKIIYRLYNMIEIYRDPCDPKLSHTYIYKECPNTAYLKRSYASSMDLFSYDDICAKDWIIMWGTK